ncbi:ubiquitin-like protein SMT3 [Teleopsis dalmanni]|uniref:ubiquitin-like protein SMT3 n=1 Tax=Teleopsis dalmanni TaxID=139649 RepID=UPI0018CD0DA0|nr:ubiquitin-like protein SMT3 [Teleopsis dalmanni]XP_037941734.1 ubiquitin-like protein SMT3 [Teleopsis dalmanni]
MALINIEIEMLNGDDQLDAAENIEVHVVGMAENITFKIDKKKPLRKMMEDFCYVMSVSMESIIFCYKDYPLSGDETPISLGLKNNDSFEAFQLKVGDF